MNIGLLITRFPPDINNGAELQIKQVAEELARRGHEVTVFTRRYHGRAFLQQQDGYVIRRRREFPVPALRMVWDTLPALRDIARHHPRPDVLLCYQTLNSGLIGVTAQSILGIPAVVSVRGSKEYRLSYSLTNRLLAPRIYGRARGLLVQSPRIRDDMHAQLEIGGKNDLSSSIRSKIRVIPNGIRLPQQEQSHGTKVVYVGRLIPNKGVADLVEALKAIRDAKTIIVGQGPDRPRLESMAQGMPVEFVGQVQPSEVVNYLKQARMLVLPSHLGDGMPNVVLEAMACGVPVITTRTAGMPDVVGHEKTGLLFDAGDIPRLKSHVERLLHDDQLWARLGQASMEAIKSYSWERVTPLIEEALRAALSSPAKELGGNTRTSAELQGCEHLKTGA